jgi:NitT/TauT family transport system substrate-binding protein
LAQASKWILAAIIIIVIAVSGALSYYYVAGPGHTTATQQKVSFMMDYYLYGAHSIFYPAISLGYYNSSNLDVSIVPQGQGSDATAQAVGAGTAQFGFANTAAAMIAISKGVPIKIIGMINDQTPCAILTLNGSGITAPQDLVGKKLGGEWGTGACETLFPGFAKQVGLNTSQVTEDTLNGESELPALLAGTVDALVVFTSSIPLWQSQVQSAGRTMESLNWSSYGVNLYGNAIIANNKTVSSDPALVSEFVADTYKGILWAYNNETGAANFFTQYNPNAETYNETLGLIRWDFEQWNQTLVNQAVSTDNPKALGLMTQSEMVQTLNWTVTYNGISNFPISEAYTNQFVASG